MEEQISLFNNSFYVLSVSTRDKRPTILEKAEQRSLERDYDLCQKARAELINPKSRLAAEISWLPGTSPKRATQVADQLRKAPRTIIAEEGLPVLAHGNALVAVLQSLTVDDDSKYISSLIQKTADIFGKVTSTRVLQDINEDRAVSGFPEVTDETLITEGLKEHKKSMSEAIVKSLDAVHTKTIITALTEIVDESTEHGSKHPNELIEQLVDLYEINAQRYLTEERSNIDQLTNAISRIAPAGASAIQPLLDELEKTMRRWDSVAQPIQLLSKTRGTNHVVSRELAGSIRNLAIELFNVHSFHDQTKRLTALLQELFAELPEVAAILKDDVGAIQNVEKANSDWEKQVTFDKEVGLFFKDKLSVSTKTINLSGMIFPIESIVQMRWGGTRHSINGIPTGTTYSVFIGDGIRYQTYTTRQEKDFGEFIDKVWRVAGVRLMGEFLTGLRTGGAYRFGEAMVFDDGVILLHRKFIGTEQIRRQWTEVSVWSANGKFVIGDTNDKSINAGASYTDDDNTHVLEATVRAAFKKPGLKKLSDLLE